MCLSTASCLDMLACAWISAARTLRIVCPPVSLPLLACARWPVFRQPGWPAGFRPAGPAGVGRRPRSAERRDDLRAEAGDHLSRVVHHRVDVELADAKVGQLTELGPHLFRRAEHAEPVD